MTNPPLDIRCLLDPAAYPWPVDTVQLIETHISWVFLAGDRVVKLKRPVDLGFVDFRDPAKRKQACEDEVRLNRRLTSDVYLGVVPVTAQGIDRPGEPLEWATLMRRMPADRMLNVLLENGTAPANLADLLAKRLIPFHRPSSSAPPSSRTESAHPSSRAESRDLLLPKTQSPDLKGVSGSAKRDSSTPVGTTRSAAGMTEECPADADVYLAVLTDNLAQVAEVASDILGDEQLRAVDTSMRAFMRDERPMLEERCRSWLSEGHGDLRCEHICLEPGALQIYDCVEFEIAIRCADIASDLAFLFMDLRRLGAASVAEELLDQYRDAGFDLPRPVIDLYAAHRALVRAKVAALERSGHDPARDLALAFEAASYLDLATSFATPVAPLLVLVSGLSGSGKSTVAEAIGRITGGTVLASDRVRKELAGLAATDSAAAEWHQGIYTGDWTERTYDRLLQLTIAELQRGRATIVDATFLDNAQRERFVSAAHANHLPAIIVWTELDDNRARIRIEQRAMARKTPSDATFAIRERQRTKLAQAPLQIPAGCAEVIIDTGRNGPASLDPLFVALRERGLIGALHQKPPAAHA